MNKKQWRDAAQSFESSLMILRKDKNGWVIGFSVHPSEIPEALLSAPLGTRFQQVLFQIGDDEQPVVPKRERENPSVAKAGELCRNSEFQDFILGETKDPFDDEARLEKKSAEALCDSLGIQSRREIVSGSDIEDGFRDILKAFSTYQMDKL